MRFIVLLLAAVLVAGGFAYHFGYWPAISKMVKIELRDKKVKQTVERYLK